MLVVQIMVFRIVIFLVLNFGALAIGGFFTGSGVSSDWYQTLNKAPWTPPGWVFGAAWTTIMLCFTVYMAFAWDSVSNHKLLVGLFGIQWLLNVLWNPVFFHYQAIIPGLLVISGLTILVGFMLFYYWPVLKPKSLLLAPYLVWLVIATSLNAYIVVKN